MSQVCDPAAAEDLTDETFVKAGVGFFTYAPKFHSGQLKASCKMSCAVRAPA